MWLMGASQEALVEKNLPASAEDASLIPGLGRNPGIGKCTLLQYSYLENSMGRVTWGAIAHGATKSQTQLSTHTCLMDTT